MLLHIASHEEIRDVLIGGILIYSNRQLEVLAKIRAIPRMELFA